MAETTPGTPQEHISDLGIRLYYHGTSVSPAETFMAEYGLMADKPTLTPSLDIATDFVGADSLLTFWYPKKQEFKKPAHNRTKPTLPIPEPIRNELIEKIEKSDLDDFYKKPLIHIAKRSKTYLPGARLGAVATATNQDVRYLASIIPPNDRGIIKKYSSNRGELEAEVEEALGELKVNFYDPDLDKKKLAQDMVRTTLEHYMLEIGQDIKYAKNSNESNLQKTLALDIEALQQVTFQESAYERYRQMLISGIQRLFAPTPGVEQK